MPTIMSIAPTPKSFPGRAHTRSGGALAGVTGTLRLLWADLRHRRRARLTRRILEGLDDRTLHDIGIGRSEIDSVVRTHAAEHRVHYDHLY